MENQETITIRFRKEFLGKNYIVTIEKPKKLSISVFLSDLIFLNDLKDEKYRKNKLQLLNQSCGKIQQKDKDILKEIKIISIKKEKQEEKLFNNEI